MHPLNLWRMLPPAGAPITLGSIAASLRACAGRPGRSASSAHSAKLARLEELKNALRAFTGLPHIFLYGSGREALARLFGVLRQESPDRDEILLPAYASFTLPASAARAGCRVRLYDLDPADLTPRLDSLAVALSPRTLAVVACHQYGFAFDLQPLKALCREAGAFLVDDAAQAMGARADAAQAVLGPLAGSMGDVGLFSLGRGKNITAVAGGVLILRNDALAACLEADSVTAQQDGSAIPAGKALALWALSHPALYRLPASLPMLRLGASVYEPAFAFKSFGPFQAGLALDGLRRLEALTAARRKLAEFYVNCLAGRSDLRPVEARPGALPVFPRFPVICDTENQAGLLKSRAARALGVSPGFPCTLDKIPGLAPHPAEPEQIYPGAALLAERLFTLPTHERVARRDLAALRALLTRPNPAPAGLKETAA